MRKINVSKIKRYGLGIVLYAIWINIGSAIDHPMERLQRPNTLFFMLATMVLLLLYVYYMARIVHLIFYSRSSVFAVFNQRLLRYRRLFFLSLALAAPTATQLLLLSAILSQHKGYGIFNTYFERDFWVFFVPMLLYGIYLYRHPQKALFTFKRVDQLEECKDRLEVHNALLMQRKLELRQENELLMMDMEQVRSAIRNLEQRQDELLVQRESLLTANTKLRRQEKLLQEQMNQLLDLQQDLAEEISLLHERMNNPALPDRKLLAAWLDQRSMPALLAYIRELDVGWTRADNCELPLHRLVCCYRKNRCFFICNIHGEKQMVPDREGQILTASDWMLKVNSSTYVNMLFCDNQLLKYKGSSDSGRGRMVRLNAAVRTSIEAVMPVAELNKLLEVSRRSREKFYSFWEHRNLLKLDESGLFLKFRIDEGEKSSS
ncbi:MAG: hypothetical protein LBJ04_17680 [Sphingobacterium sp.]|jgi:hypothetical protein|nr:hypothetical protein [Sphingobacterium sp.]